MVALLRLLSNWDWVFGFCAIFGIVNPIFRLPLECSQNVWNKSKLFWPFLVSFTLKRVWGKIVFGESPDAPQKNRARVHNRAGHRSSRVSLPRRVDFVLLGRYKKLQNAALAGGRSSPWGFLFIGKSARLGQPGGMSLSPGFFGIFISFRRST